MMLGSVVTATGGGFLMNKISYRSIMIPTTLILVGGTVLLTTLSPESPRWLVTIYMIVVGLGIGASFSVLSNAAIHLFEPRQRGSASSTLNFLRSLGMTLGITVFGIIQSHAFTRKLTDSFAGQGKMPAGIPTGDPHTLLDPTKPMEIPAPILEKISTALSSSIVLTFAWTVLPAVLAVICAIAMSKEKLDPAAQEGAMSH
jgi:MFS family permease